MALDLEVTIGLFIIFLVVLTGSFKVRIIEHNLEALLLTCESFGMMVLGFANLTGAETG